MRPAIYIELKGLEGKLKEHLQSIIEEKGPLTERELEEEALKFLAALENRLIGKIVERYKIITGRRIGKNTAKMNLLKAFRNLLSRVKKGFLFTLKPVYDGKRRYGRIFYVRGQEGKIPVKVRSILLRGKGRAAELMRKIESGEAVEVTPVWKRAAELLEYYGLGRTYRVDGRLYFGPEGLEKRFIPKRVEIEEKTSSIRVPVLAGGKVGYRELSFDIIEVKDGCLILGIKKDYISIFDVKELQRKALLVNIPSKLVVVCKEISKRAEGFCRAWGIDVIKLQG